MAISTKPELPPGEVLGAFLRPQFQRRDSFVETQNAFTTSPTLSWCQIIGPMDLHRSFTTIGRDLI